MLLVKRICPDNCDAIDFALCAVSAIENEISLTRMRKVELPKIYLKPATVGIFSAKKATHV